MTVFRACSLVVAVLVAVPAAAAPRRLLLLDLAAQSVPQELAASLTDLLDLELTRGGLFEVVSQQDLRGMLRAEELRQLVGEDTASDAALTAIAEAANAPYLLRGSLGRVGGSYLLSLDLVEASTRQVVRRVSQTLVGDAEGLVGSLRTAALALNLEEKGVTRDMSAELIDSLQIAEKEKTLLVALMPGYEVPVGPVQDPQSVAYLRPSLFELRLTVERPVWRWLRLMAGVGFATSLGAEQRDQDKHLAFVYDAASGEKVGEKTLVATTTVPYDVVRVPLFVGAKIAPATGRLLPYLSLAAGASWMRYALSNEELGLLREQQGGQCAAPYAPSDGYCTLDLVGKPSGSISTWTLDLVATTGVEWLATHNLGARVEAGYELSYALAGARELDAVFVTDPILYDAGGEARAEVYGDTFPVRRVQHGVRAGVAIVMYW